MSLHETVSAERIHIGFFGLRNAGKSSIVNAVTGQDLSVVSDVKGTTTDPVKKAMEILPLGPVVILDTPGLDDEGELGELRVQKAKKELAHSDIAILVVDGLIGLSDLDLRMIDDFKERKLPFILVWNKSDLLPEDAIVPEGAVKTSARTGDGIFALKEKIAQIGRENHKEKKILVDLVSPGDVVVLVIPVDESAPKGRLILPQQQTLRELLDLHCIPICCQDTELAETLNSLSIKPKLVITDSQAFKKVSAVTPDDILLTSFSILFARYKGDLKKLICGAAALSSIKNGDKVLISEGCTHHRQCNDIGTVKMPGWIESFSGAKPEYVFTSGGTFPENLSDYSLIVHCGGCMLNEPEMKHRMEIAENAGVPMVNYGIAIAQMHGILERSLRPFPDALRILNRG